MYIVSRHFKEVEENTAFTTMAYYLSIAFVFTSYPFVVWESLAKSDTIKYLSRIIDRNGEGKHTVELTEANGTITVVAESFHMEQRSRQLSQLSEQGHVKYYREFFPKAVVTWKGFKHIEFKYTANRSSLANIGASLHGVNNKITRLHINSEVVFADVETEQEYEKIKDDFIEYNRLRDRHIRCYVSGNVTSWQNEWLCLENNDCRPIWLSRRVYIACTMLWLAWPYRFVFNMVTSKVEFTMKKAVSNFAQPSTTTTTSKC